MGRFEALDVALELAEALGPLLPLIAQHDRKMEQQLRDAGASVPSCFSEGAQRQAKDRLHFYRISGGSAAEVRTQLRLAVAWRYIGAATAAPAAALADRCVALAWRLTHPQR